MYRNEAKVQEAKEEVKLSVYQSMRGRRSTVCANPVEADPTWKPNVIPKTKQEAKRIKETIESIFLFRALDDKELRLVVDAFGQESHKQGKKIINEGDVGEFFYVVDSGRCEIVVGGRKVSEVGPGDFFGELALMYNAPRAASVCAITDVELFVMDQETFKRTILGATLRKRKLYCSFLEKVAILESMSEYERLTLADALVPCVFEAGDEIIRQDDDVCFATQAERTRIHSNSHVVFCRAILSIL